MSNSDKRVDSASKIIKASSQTIYKALVDPEAIKEWKPPQGMRCHIYEFNGEEGGLYRMAFEYDDTSISGKTSANADIFTGQFLELIPGKKVVEKVNFESDKPEFAGAMTITTELQTVPGGTKVAFTAEDVPEGITPEDHNEGMMSSLNNLAVFTEGV